MNLDSLGYLGVFLGAAIPMVELLVVIPAGIAIGLNPVLVGITAFAGNALTVAAVVALGDRAVAWYQQRRPPRSDRRGQRGARLLERYGLPGLALVGPVSTGSHIAALLALGLRMPPVRVLVWCVIGLAAWSAVAAVVATAGLGAIFG